MRIVTLVCAGSLSLVFSIAAFAFEAAAPDDSTMPKGAAAVEMNPRRAASVPNADLGPRSARSLECSQKADAQALHGKPRKHFMRRCKGGM